MSACVFLASDKPFHELEQGFEVVLRDVDCEIILTKKKYLAEIFYDVMDDKTACNILDYIKRHISKSQTLELWCVWSSSDVEKYQVETEDLSISKLTKTKLQEIDNIEIWNNPARQLCFDIREKKMDVIKFIKECGVFFVVTIDNGLPACRPFGAIMEYDNDLYISTSDTKNVYTQLKNNQSMQIVALENGTRNWIRIDGEAEECFDVNIKQRMLDECPVLTKHFSGVNAPHYTVFKIEIKHKEMYRKCKR